MKCKINSNGNLQGAGTTSMMEVRELERGRYYIMHVSNGAILYYGDGRKEEAERILRLWTNAELMRANLEEFAERFPELDTDEPLSGSDAVDRLNDLWPLIKQSIE